MYESVILMRSGVSQIGQKRFCLEVIVERVGVSLRRLFDLFDGGMRRLL